MQPYLAASSIKSLFCTLLEQVLGSIVVSIPACHAGDRGSIQDIRDISSVKRTKTRVDPLTKRIYFPVSIKIKKDTFDMHCMKFFNPVVCKIMIRPGPLTSSMKLRMMFNSPCKLNQKYSFLTFLQQQYTHLYILSIK